MEITALVCLQMQYTQIQQTQLISLISHAHIALKKRRMLLQCRGDKSFRDRREGCRERDGNYLLPASSCQPLSGAVPQQLSDQRQIKVSRDRHAATGEHLSGPPIFRHDAAR